MKTRTTRRKKLRLKERRAKGNERASKIANVLGRPIIQTKSINGTITLTISPQDLKEYFAAKYLVVEQPYSDFIQTMIDEKMIELNSLSEEDAIALECSFYKTVNQKIEITADMFIKYQTSLIDAAIASIYGNVETLALIAFEEHKQKEFGSPEEMVSKFNMPLEKATKIWESVSKGSKAWAERAIDNYRLHVYGMIGLDDEDTTGHGGFRYKKSDLNSTENQLFKDHYHKVSCPLWDKAVAEYINIKNKSNLNLLEHIQLSLPELKDQTSLLNKLFGLTNAPIKNHPGLEEIKLEYAARLCPSYKPDVHEPSTLKKYLDKKTTYK